MVSYLEINKTLDRVDTPSFFDATAIAGGHETVRSILLETPELKYLIHHQAEAVPAILHRLDHAGRIKHEETRIAYFLVLEKSREKRAIPDLLHYIESLPEKDRERVESPWHPFRYAVEALIALTALKVHSDSTQAAKTGTNSISPRLELKVYSDSTQALFAQRHAIVAHARAVWEHGQDHQNK